jgi:SAM-dependent methyltransferase
MDARELKFLDETFNTVTAFFSLMYMRRADHEQVFCEVWRVLAPGGRFLIWDANLARPAEPGKDMVMVPLHVKLPNYEVLTGYGVYWPEQPKDRPHYIALAERLGFTVVSQSERAHTFFLELHKP